MESEFDPDAGFAEIAHLWPPKAVEKLGVDPWADREAAKQIYLAGVHDQELHAGLLGIAAKHAGSRRGGSLRTFMEKSLGIRPATVSAVTPVPPLTPYGSSAVVDTLVTTRIEKAFQKAWTAWPHSLKGRPERVERARDAFFEAAGDGSQLEALMTALAHHDRLVEDGASSRYWMSSFITEGWKEYAEAASKYPSREEMAGARAAFEAYPKLRRSSWSAALDSYVDNHILPHHAFFMTAMASYVLNAARAAKADPEDGRHDRWLVSFPRFCSEWRERMEVESIVDLLHDPFYRAICDAGLDNARNYGEWCAGALRYHFKVTGLSLREAVIDIISKRINGTVEQGARIAQALELHLDNAVLASSRKVMEKGGGMAR